MKFLLIIMMVVALSPPSISNAQNNPDDVLKLGRPGRSELQRRRDQASPLDTKIDELTAVQQVLTYLQDYVKQQKDSLQAEETEVKALASQRQSLDNAVKIDRAQLKDVLAYQTEEANKAFWRGVIISSIISAVSGAGIGFVLERFLKCFLLTVKRRRRAT